MLCNAFAVMLLQSDLCRVYGLVLVHCCNVSIVFFFLIKQSTFPTPQQVHRPSGPEAGDGRGLCADGDREERGADHSVAPRPSQNSRAETPAEARANGRAQILPFQSLTIAHPALD